MPAQPLPARGAGDYVIDYRSYPTHLGATLYRRASSGALIELGRETVPYHFAQDTLARVEGIPYSDELGWESDPDELGALGKKIKAFAKKVAKSNLGKIIKNVGKIATSFVPGGSAITASFGIAKKVGTAIAAKKQAARAPAPRPAPRLVSSRPTPRPAPQRVISRPPPEPAYEYAYEPELDGEEYYQGEVYDGEEMGAAKKKPAAKKPPAKKPAAKKPAAKKPAAKKPAAKKPAPKKPAKKAAAPSKKPATKKNPAPPKKPLSATARKAAVQRAGGPAQTLLRAAASAPTPQKAVQAQKLAALVTEIEDAAPELAATIATLPDTPPHERDLIDLRAVEAAQALAAKPPEERAAAAAKIESRIDAYKVVAPDGSTIWVPLEAVEEG